MKRVILFLFSVFLLGCPPTPESGTISLGEVSVSPATGYNTTENFKFTAAFSVTTEATLSVEVRDAAGKAVKKLSENVKAGEKSKAKQKSQKGKAKQKRSEAGRKPAAKGALPRAEVGRNGGAPAEG